MFCATCVGLSRSFLTIEIDFRLTKGLSFPTTLILIHLHFLFSRQGLKYSASVTDVQKMGQSAPPLFMLKKPFIPNDFKPYSEFFFLTSLLTLTFFRILSFSPLS
uniref:Uncharacterized protein n=1 Tax=Sphaerodactylus townsendi TaxID=933632 RepID=A0ACB8EYH4_9SAUR